MDCAPEEAVGPVAEEVTNVDEDRRQAVRFRAGRRDGDGGPGVLAGEDLEPRLAAEAEEECDGAVVGVGSGADVVWVGGGG